MARKFGLADLMCGEFGDLFDRTFARPIADTEYQSNRLQPGALPLEWSFSEAEPDALRIELQPFDPTLVGAKRLRRTVKALVPVVESHHGKELAARFESAARIASTSDLRLNFGAFVGLVQRPHGDHEFKIYVECDPEDPALLSGDLPTIAGVAPHFLSIAVATGAVSRRTYYICREGLRALDLEGVCAALGMSHRFPALLMTMLELTDGEFHLPPNSVLLGVRRHGQESELKVELVCGTAMSPYGMIGRIERLLEPNTVVAFQRWASSVYPKDVDKLPVSVVSIKVSTTQSVRLSVYAAEPWRLS